MRAAAALLLLAAAPVSAAPVDGIWGVAERGVVACSGVKVLVLRDGRYTKAQLDLGTTEGPRDLVVGTAGYSFDGILVVVAPSLSLAEPEPRQVYRWDPVSDTLRREAPPPVLTYGRCPDRPLRPMTR